MKRYTPYVRNSKLRPEDFEAARGLHIIGKTAALVIVLIFFLLFAFYLR